MLVVVVAEVGEEDDARAAVGLALGPAERLEEDGGGARAVGVGREVAVREGERLERGGAAAVVDDDGAREPAGRRAAPRRRRAAAEAPSSTARRKEGTSGA